MPIPTITVTGTVYDPSGGVADGGRIVITPYWSASVNDGTNDCRLGGTYYAAIAASTGAVSFPIVPTVSMTPSGNVYECVFYANLYHWRETWGPIPTGTSIDIGAITRQDTLPDLTGPYQAPYYTSLPTPSGIWDGVCIRYRAPGKMTKYMVCLEGYTGGTYAWKPLASGEGT